MTSKLIDSLIKKDYELIYNSKLPLQESAKQALIPQTIQGHAREGHMSFKKNPVDLTMDEIFISLGMKPFEKRRFREGLIYEAKECLENLVSGRINKLITKKGQPLFGAYFLLDQEIDLSKETFKGAALAGRMDTDYWRKRTVEIYKKALDNSDLIIGGGMEYPVNLLQLAKHGLGLKNLSEEEHDDKTINEYYEKGILCENGSYSDGIQNTFIRHRLGLGCCDDASLISIGKIHGPSALLLGWVVDAVDTYSKCTLNSIEGGFDEWVGESLEKLWKKKHGSNLITPEETMEIIYLGAKNNFPRINMSSSHRRFNEIGPKQSHPTILNHLAYVKQGIIPQEYPLGFQKIPSTEFYNSINQRFELFEKSLNFD